MVAAGGKPRNPLPMAYLPSRQSARTAVTRRTPPAARRPAARGAALGFLAAAALWEACWQLESVGQGRSRPIAPERAFISAAEGEAYDGIISSDWSPSTLAGTFQSMGGYLLESGYLWPVLGFFVACLLLVRSAGLRGSPSSAALRAFEPPQPSILQAGSECQVPPGYALVPLDAAQYGFHQHHQQLAPIWEDDASHSSNAGDWQVAEKEEVTAQDFKALLDRTQQDDALSEGIARIRQTLLGQRDDSRPGLMTARKVLEIERVLIQELEESFTQKVGYVASCFHRWRCEAHFLRIGRRYEEDFDMQKGEWERYLDGHEKTFEQKVLDAARKAAEQDQRHRSVAALLLDQWAHGDNVALSRSSFKTWQEWTQRQHSMRVQTRQISTVVQLWVQGGIRGSMHVCWKSWSQLSRERREAAEQEREQQAADASWDRFFDAERAKLQDKLNATLADVDSRRARAEQDVGMALATWERGLRTGLLAIVLQTWSQHARKMQRFHCQQQTVHQAVLQLCGGQATGLLKGCFAGWRSIASHEALLASEKKKWEALLSGERQRWAEEDQVWEESRQNKKAAAKQLVSLTLDKWECGEHLGLLLKVFTSWSEDTSKTKAAKRRSESVHASVLRWLEGVRETDLRTCFLHWRVLAEATMINLKQEQELLSKRERWEEHLADECRRRDSQLQNLETSTERRVQKAHAIVELTLTRWQLGDRSGYALQALLSWRTLAIQNRRLAQQRQAVHTALLKSLVGRERGFVQSCLLNWKMLARHTIENQFGEKRMAEERRKWEEFLENETKAHAEGLQRAHAKADEKWTYAEEALGALLSKWHKSETKSLVHVSFLGWRQLSVASATLNCGRQLVHLAVFRFFDGDRRGAAHGFFLNWKHWARMEALFKTEVAERKRTIVQLEERADRLISTKQTRLLKYAGVLSSCTDPMIVTTVMAAWRMHAIGIKSSEAHRQLEVALQEQRRLHDIAAMRRKQLTAASLRVLGAKDQAAVAMDCFLAWVRQWQEAKQEWAHQLAHSEIIKKYSWYIQCMVSKDTDETLVAACFWELLREAKQQRHQREREDMHNKLSDVNIEIQNLEAEQQNISDQLKMAYKQIDNMSETLQKELKSKEELAAELREGYDKLRQMSQRKSSTLSRASMVSSTIREGAELPHLPATIHGAPGGRDLDLHRSLVEDKSEGASTPSSASGRKPADASNWKNAAERLFAGRT